MTHLIDPLKPSSSTTVTAAAPGADTLLGPVIGTQPSQQTARLELNNTHTCPVRGCGKRMTPILCARQIPSYICWDHRVVLPQPDPVAQGTNPVVPATQPAATPAPVYSTKET